MIPQECNRFVAHCRTAFPLAARFETSLTVGNLVLPRGGDMAKRIPFVPCIAVLRGSPVGTADVRGVTGPR